MGLLGFSFAHATDPTTGGNGKKNDINGSVIQLETRKPVKEVNITAYLESKKEKVVSSDDTGNYAFDDLKPGTYKFVFEKIGFKKVVKEKVRIKTDESFQLNIEMIANNDYDLAPTPLHFSDY
ncbi:MAG: hypothetical protein JWM28_737 [Chitinophagaceae bacterium]|nr:hypothetical protein [Chitinophagaceae bacterium]